MKIYYNIDDFSKLDYAVVTSGTFDGVHVGHQQILNRLKEVSSKHQGETVVITFWPHPRLVLQPADTTLKLLNTFEEKAELLKAQAIDHLLRIPFTKEFSQITATEFISSILVEKIGTRKLVIGYDHRFGKNRGGSFEELKSNGPEYGFDVEEIPRQDVDHVAVSSSKIREALETGNIDAASLLLGRPYSIFGRVVLGQQLGRQLGFPTANLEIDSHHKLIPKEGIYAVTVEYGHESFGGMLYIGNRPTLNGKTQSIEVNIFDFNQDVYGQNLKINFIRFLREDIKFEDLKTLKDQLDKDKIASLQALNETRII